MLINLIKELRHSPNSSSHQLVDISSAIPVHSFVPPHYLFGVYIDLSPPLHKNSVAHIRLMPGFRPSCATGNYRPSGNKWDTNKLANDSTDTELTESHVSSKNDSNENTAKYEQIIF